MKVKTLIKKLQKFNPEAEMYIDSGDRVSPIESVFDGFYVDDGFNAIDVVSIATEDDKEAYGIPKNAKKVVCIE